MSSCLSLTYESLLADMVSNVLLSGSQSSDLTLLANHNDCERGNCRRQSITTYHIHAQSSLAQLIINSTHAYYVTISVLNIQLNYLAHMKCKSSKLLYFVGAYSILIEMKFIKLVSLYFQHIHIYIIDCVLSFVIAVLYMLLICTICLSKCSRSLYLHSLTSHAQICISVYLYNEIFTRNFHRMIDSTISCS